jgi:hypothetical protein
MGMPPVEANEAIDKEISPSGEGMVDDETLAFFAKEICQMPFTIAVDFGDDWEVLRKGVCYHFDFEPTPEQVDSGLIPCP